MGAIGRVRLRRAAGVLDDLLYSIAVGVVRVADAQRRRAADPVRDRGDAAGVVVGVIGDQTALPRATPQLAGPVIGVGGGADAGRGDTREAVGGIVAVLRHLARGIGQREAIALRIVAVGELGVVDATGNRGGGASSKHATRERQQGGAEVSSAWDGRHRRSLELRALSGPIGTG